MTAKIAILTVSDRAAAGVYEDKGGPAIEAWLRRAIVSDVEILRQIVPDGRESVADAFRHWADTKGADLILATGGTGPSPRDLTPEAMDDVVERHFPGFGELMRAVSLREVPTAILSRQGAGTRGKCLIITLPGKPSAIGTCLDAVFPAVPYCLDLMGAARIETDPEVCKAFRPKK